MGKTIMVIIQRGIKLTFWKGIRTDNYVKTRMGKSDKGWIIPRDHVPTTLEWGNNTKRIDGYFCVPNEPYCRNLDVPKINASSMIDLTDLEGESIGKPLKSIMAGTDIVSNELLITLIDGSIAKRLISPIIMMGFAVIMLVYGIILGLMFGNPTFFASPFGMVIFMGLFGALFGYMIFSEGGGMQA